MNVVIDTNVFVSAIISERGSPAAVLELLRSRDIEVGITDALLSELRNVLARPGLMDRVAPDLGARMLNRLEQFTRMPSDTEVEGVFRDSSDHRLLEACVTFGADYLVSGDRGVLALGEYRGTQIVGPAQFLALFVHDDALA